MIKLTSISKSFGTQWLFQDASLQLESGERLGVVGRNGHGKTTLFKLILGQEFLDSGEILVPKNYRLGYLEQHIHFQKSSLIEEACQGLPEDRQEEKWTAEKILMGLGFSVADLNKDPKLFSGGFQLRINLAKALLQEPHLLLLDEPTNYLDIVSIRWLEKFLSKWPNELMVISHDLSFLDAVSTHTLSIYRKKFVRLKGSSTEVFRQIQIEEEVHEKTRLNDEKKRKKEEEFISKFRAKARQAGMVQSRIKSLEKKEQLEKLEKIQNLDFSFRYREFPAKIMFSAYNLRFNYVSTQNLIIDGFSMQVAPRDKIAIIGPNGRGKSTLLKLLANELTPSSGNIKLHPLLEWGYFEQSNTRDLNPHFTIAEEISRCNPDLDKTQVRNICGAMMFEGDQALKKIEVLSGGEKSRVCLGKLLAKPYHLLFLDEPTNHLDPESCIALQNALNNFEGAVIFVTHNENILREVPTKLVVFEQGKHFVFEDTYEQFLSQIGWASEGLSETQSDVSREKFRISKKDDRRQRAERQKEKSKILKPLLDKQIELESRINSQEKEIETIHLSIIEASTKGEGQKISQLSTELHTIQVKCQELYNRLEYVMQDIEKIESLYID